MLLDTHHHFDFLPGPGVRRHFLAALAERDVRVVAQPLTPSSFGELVGGSPTLDGCGPLPLWSLGFHPWWVESQEQAHAELEVFEEALGQTRLIGEIGLDLSPRRVADAPAELQRQVLRQLLDQVCRAASATTSAEPYVLSIHAVRAASEVLDLLDELAVAERNVVPVLHRFSGTSQELTRLIRLGGLVSIHPEMLAGRRGRAYAQQVPTDRLLLESDLPTGPVDEPSESDEQEVGQAAADELVASLTTTLDRLLELRGEDVASEIARTQARLYAVG